MSDTSWMVYDYPEPDEEIIPECPYCQDVLTETVFFIDGKAICEDCFLEYIKDFTAEEFADALGVDHKDLNDYMEDIQT